jgi:hypothetical protein
MKSEMSDSTKALGKAIAPLRRAELRIDDARFPSFTCRVCRLAIHAASLGPEADICCGQRVKEMSATRKLVINRTPA